jgi:hypothetical protein
METVRVICGCGTHKNIPDKTQIWQCPSCSRPNTYTKIKDIEDSVEQLANVVEKIKSIQEHKPIKKEWKPYVKSLKKE